MIVFLFHTVQAIIGEQLLNTIQNTHLIYTIQNTHLIWQVAPLHLWLYAPFIAADNCYSGASLFLFSWNNNAWKKDSFEL